MQTENRVAVGGIGLGRAVKWLRVVGVAAIAALVGMSTSSLAQGGGAQATAQNDASSSLPSLSSNQWNTFVADVTVRVTRVKADGTPIGVATAPMQYHWERSQSGAGWKTIMTIADRATTVGSGESRQSLANPFAVARIEDDEDGSPLRMYARSGRRVQAAPVDELQRWTEAGLQQLQPADATVLRSLLPRVDRVDHVALARASGGSRPFVGGSERDWIGGFVATPEQRTARRTRLTQQFVRAGQIRGLDRFTRFDGDRTHEVLIDPQSAVTLEVNTLRDRQLLSHTTMSYQLAADASLVRRALHVEQVLSPATGARAITDTEYANVRVERRR